MKSRERLTIKNFFSIADFDWDIKGFNVITGGMASGKSIVLKLLFFCEHIFDQTIFEAAISKELFQKENFFNKVAENFNKIFISKEHESDYSAVKIDYRFELNKSESEQSFDTSSTFDLAAEWDTKSKKLQWSSNYIEKKLETWQSFFDTPNTPELRERVRRLIFEAISSDFSRNFPLAAVFIPASRAIAAITNNINSRDIFITDFMNLKDFALSFNRIGGISGEMVSNILQFKNISMEDEKNNQPVFELINGRSISSLELSSGQQELLYLLLLIDDLKRTGFSYGEYASIFIEEPSAHLFPKEQKETIEFIAASFNELQKKNNYNAGHHFFISTHSPYVLNTINNILEKGRLLKLADKIKDPELKTNTKKSLEALAFPSLPIENVSAYMIEKNGVVKSMIHKDDDEPYIYSEVIDQISQEITTGTEKLYDINNKIKNSI